MDKTIHQIIDERASCRSFKQQAIPNDVLNQLLLQACKAPSAGGFQNYSIIKIIDQSIKDALVPLCRNQGFISKAPISLVFCIDFRKIIKMQQIEPFPFEETSNFMNLWMSILDTAICAQTLVLSAEYYGLKSIYIGNIINNMKQVSELLKLPDYVLPSIMLTLGYPKSVPKPSAKFTEEIIVHENTYNETPINQLKQAYEDKYHKWKLQPKNKWIDMIYKTSKAYKNEEFAQNCIDFIKRKNCISPYQYWFGCYYADDDFMRIEDYINFIREKGFKWL